MGAALNCANAATPPGVDPLLEFGLQAH